MKFLKYIFIVFCILLYALPIEAQTTCKAVQLKIYPDLFGASLDQGIGKRKRDGKRNPSMAFHVNYKVVKNSNYGQGGLDTLIFDTGDKKCYQKQDIKNGNAYQIFQMKGDGNPYYTTLCFEGDMDMSSYYILVDAVAFGWDERRYARKPRYRNTPNCSTTNNGSEKNTNFDGEKRISLALLNNMDNMLYPLLKNNFSFLNRIEKTDVSYPQLSMPEVIDVCANNFPYTLNLSSYIYNLEMKYFPQRSTTIKKYNSSNNTWSVVSGMDNSSAISFDFNDASTARRYAVYTQLNADCWMTDTFTLNVLDTAEVISTLPVLSGNPLIYGGTICKNGTGILNITEDETHRTFLWQDGYDACLSRYNNLAIEDTGYYYLKVIRDNGCYGRRIFRVDYKNTEVVKFNPTDVLACFDPSLPSPYVQLSTTLSQNNDYSFKWSTKEVTPEIIVRKPGAYKVEATDTYDCISYATVNVIDTCSYPVHSDVVSNSIVTYINKTEFKEDDYNIVTLEDPRSISGAIEYENDDIIDRKYIVRLQYHRSSKSDNRADIWTLLVPYQITVDNHPTELRTLHLEKTNGDKDLYESIFEHDGGDLATLQIIKNNIAAYDKDGNPLNFETEIPEDINLELELKTIHVPFFTSSVTINGNTLIDNHNTADQKIDIGWQPIKSAIEYELEIAFIDALDKNQTATESVFKEKGWSIVTPNNSYTIDATYPKGKIIYRLRPLGRHTSFVNNNYNHVINGTWSSIKEIDLNTNPFEADKNWSKVVTFAEEGKKKEVVTYMDGTFRTKQVLTNLNTEGITLAAETFYDHESRGTLNVLPVPLTNNSLKYQENLNTIDGSVLINKEFVDGLIQQPLSTSSGAAQYYSPNNLFRNNPDFTNKVNIDALPDAEGYVSTKVEYSRDNTGRIIKQSGVGEEFSIDDDSEEKHVTQYFYNTPTQTELHRLFGSNVGKAVFYSKQMVVDPNGQVSVSYLNNSEKVIATALSGNAPGNLDAIERPEPSLMTINMSENNIKDSLNKTSTSINIIGNDVVGKDYTFFYEIGTDKNGGLLNNNNYCKNCKYKLELSVSNPKGLAVALSHLNLPNGDGITTTTILNDNNDVIKIEAILDADLCANENYSYPNIEFSASFEKTGNYTYTKKLTLLDDDETDIQDFLEQIEFPSLEEFIQANIGDYIDTLVCRNDCESRTAVYIRDLRYQDSLAGNIKTTSQYIAIKDSLVERGFCDPFLAAQFDAPEYAKRYCEDMLMNMVRQISPGEKYFDSINNNSLVYSLISNSTGSNRDSLITWNILRSSSANGANSKDSVIYRWNDEAARKIVHLFGNIIHPEYCHYTNCIRDTAHNAFDIKMGLIDSYEEAVIKGYIAPNGNSYEFGTVLQAEINALTGLQDALNTYIKIPRRNEGIRTYLLTTPVNIIDNRIQTIDIINATRPYSVYYNPMYLSPPLADSGYNTAFLYYRDSCETYSGNMCTKLSPEYDKNGDAIISQSEWNDQFWLRFKTAFLATKKQFIAKYYENEGCEYLNDEEAIVKNPNISIEQGLITASSYHSPQAYQANCTNNASAIVDKLARECKAIGNKIKQDSVYRNALIDTFTNYCIRNTGIYNPYGFITQNDIDSGKLGGIIASINFNASGSDTCNLEDILNTGIEYFYSIDSIGSVIVKQVCLDSGMCSIKNIIDIANQYEFQYPKTDSLIFREGFDGSGNTHYFADAIYKNAGQLNGLVVNSSNVIDQLGWPYLLSFIANNDCGPFEFTSYLATYPDAMGGNISHYLYNHTLNDNAGSQSGIFWRNQNPIHVVAGQHYALSYHLANHSFGNLNIVPVIKNAQNGQVIDTLITDPDTIACMGAWNKYNHLWKAPHGVDSIYIEMFNREPNSWGNDFSFDELKLETTTDTIAPEIPCAGNKSYKINITPSEITANFNSCTNNNNGGGLYTLFFVDSTGARVNNIAALSGRTRWGTVPFAGTPTYTHRNVSYSKEKYTAELTDNSIKTVYMYIASCALTDWSFDNDNNPADERCADIVPIRNLNDLLVSGSNHACERTFDTCVVKFIPELDSITVNRTDSLGEWYPDTSFQACIDRQIRAQQGWLTQMYKDSLAKILTAYRTAHIANCFKNLNEELYYQTTFDEYHYTLYYYDQQGNLVQTVPPAGVYPVPSGGFTDKGVWLGGAANEPKHILKTIYQYNTRQQPITQHSPDGGLSSFWYNKKGQLILSQNENQKPTSFISSLEQTPSLAHQSRFSFTNYDALGRIVLVGEIVTPDNFAYKPDAVIIANPTNQTQINNNKINQRRRDTLNVLVNNVTFPLNFVGTTGYELINLVQTEYDYSSLLPSINQKNLHNRVSATYAYDNYDKLLAGDGIATIYSYDEVGNVQTVVQDMSKYTALADLPQNVEADRLKKQIDYDYDLVSGKVNAVVFNHGKLDEFKHRYEYDADNRITDVYTSDNNRIEHHDAKYFYYPHGPLARIELGNNKVQSLDYAYTLQGWLKGINFIDETNDLNQYFAKEQFQYLLGYNRKDYKQIGGQNYNSENDLYRFAPYYENLSSRYQGLYNGNIAYTVNVLNGLSLDSVYYLNKLPLLAMEYRYDQLNRIKSAKGQSAGINDINSDYSNFGNWQNQGFDLYDAYRTSYSYDPNGNITQLMRTAPDFASKRFKLMDDLDYVYAKNEFDGLPKLLNNRLYQVFDHQIDSNRFTTDIDNQTSTVDTTPSNLPHPNTNLTSLGNSNYEYDKIGQLTKDLQEGIDAIFWTPYGKIDSIAMMAPKSDLKFKYDATGNRIAKIEYPKPIDSVAQLPKVTYYFRDAQGNPIDIVQPKYKDSIYTEQHEYNIYGSSRLGTWNKTIDFISTNGIEPNTQTFGNKQYELNNHLGNVMTTVADQKYISSTQGNPAGIYQPVVTTVTDYYPFGMPMPGRTLIRQNDPVTIQTISSEDSSICDNWQNYFNNIVHPFLQKEFGRLEHNTNNQALRMLPFSDPFDEGMEDVQFNVGFRQFDNLIPGKVYSISHDLISSNIPVEQLMGGIAIMKTEDMTMENMSGEIDLIELAEKVELREGNISLGTHSMQFIPSKSSIVLVLGYAAEKEEYDDPTLVTEIDNVKLYLYEEENLNSIVDNNFTSGLGNWTSIVPHADNYWAFYDYNNQDYMSAGNLNIEDGRARNEVTYNYALDNNSTSVFARAFNVEDNAQYTFSIDYEFPNYGIPQTMSVFVFDANQIQNYYSLNDILSNEIPLNEPNKKYIEYGGQGTYAINKITTPYYVDSIIIAVIVSNNYGYGDVYLDNPTLKKVYTYSDSVVLSIDEGNYSNCSEYYYDCYGKNYHGSLQWQSPTQEFILNDGSTMSLSFPTEENQLYKVSFDIVASEPSSGYHVNSTITNNNVQQQDYCSENDILTEKYFTYEQNISEEYYFTAHSDEASLLLNLVYNTYYSDTQQFVIKNIEIVSVGTQSYVIPTYYGDMNTTDGWGNSLLIEPNDTTVPNQVGQLVWDNEQLTLSPREAINGSGKRYGFAMKPFFGKAGTLCNLSFNLNYSSVGNNTEYYTENMLRAMVVSEDVINNRGVDIVDNDGFGEDGFLLIKNLFNTGNYDSLSFLVPETQNYYVVFAYVSDQYNASITIDDVLITQEDLTFSSDTFLLHQTFTDSNYNDTQPWHSEFPNSEQYYFADNTNNNDSSVLIMTSIGTLTHDTCTFNVQSGILEANDTYTFFVRDFEVTPDSSYSFSINYKTDADIPLMGMLFVWDKASILNGTINDDNLSEIENLKTYRIMLIEPNSNGIISTGSFNVGNTQDLVIALMLGKETPNDFNVQFDKPVFTKISRYDTVTVENYDFSQNPDTAFYNQVIQYNTTETQGILEWDSIAEVLRCSVDNVNYWNVRSPVIMRHFPTIAGKTYAVSFDYNTNFPIESYNGVGFINGKLNTPNLNIAQNIIAEYSNQLDLGSNTFSFTASGNYSSVYIHAQADYDSMAINNYYFEIDNFAIKELAPTEDTLYTHHCDSVPDGWRTRIMPNTDTTTNSEFAYNQAGTLIWQEAAEDLRIQHREVLNSEMAVYVKHLGVAAKQQTVEAGTPHILSLDIKSKSANTSNAMILIADKDSYDTYGAAMLMGGSPALIYVWQEMPDTGLQQFIFTPLHDEIVIAILHGTSSVGGHLDFDDVKIIKHTPIIHDIFDTSIVPWRSTLTEPQADTTYFVGSLECDSTNQKLKVHLAMFNNSLLQVSAVTGFALKEINVQPNSRYQLKIDVSNTIDTSLIAQAGFLIWGEDGLFASEPLMQLEGLTGNFDGTHSLSFTTDAATNNIVLQVFMMLNDSTQNNLYFTINNVTLEEVSGGLLYTINPHSSLNKYRFGFNGQERETELSTSHTSAEFWMYDGRIGRRWNVDPKAEKFPYASPYNFVLNNPLTNIDPDGAEVIIGFNKQTGKLAITDLDHYKKGLPIKVVSAKDYVHGGIRDDKGNLTHNQILVLDNVFSGGRVESDGTITRDLERDKYEVAIPNGSYDLTEYEGGRGWYKVDPIDESRYDDHHQGYKNADGETRSGYRFHLGGLSHGCITVCDPNGERQAEWDVVGKILENTSKTEVPKREGMQKYIPGTTRMKYGTINVTGTDRVKEVKKEE